jgi:hypothetical protein
MSENNTNTPLMLQVTDYLLDMRIKYTKKLDNSNLSEEDKKIINDAGKAIQLTKNCMYGYIPSHINK